MAKGSGFVRGGGDPLVSVVTPTLNRRDLLLRTMLSVQQQTYGTFEHIVVDGGSSDGTLEMLRRFDGTYPMRWVSDTDGGMYEAINRGLHSASGEIMAYLNSDDLYFPWTLQVVVDHFRKHPDADFIYGSALTIEDATGRQHLNFHLPFDTDFIRRVGFLCQPAVFWKRRVFESEGAFDESLRYVADCEYWMRSADRWKFVQLNEFVAIERDHQSTLRESHAEALNAELALVRSRYVKSAGLRHRLQTARHALREYVWLRVAWARFAVQSIRGRGRPGGPWARLINSGNLRIRWPLAAIWLIPGSRRYRPPLISRSRTWLEPPGAALGRDD